MLVGKDVTARTGVAGGSSAGDGGFERSDRRAVIVLLALFVVSRGFYYLLGVRFQATSEVKYLPQLLAPDLLRHHLLESIWYLHTQPPLFNLLIGVALKWSPLPYGISFQVIFVGAGVLLTLGLYDLGRQLNLGPRTAAVVTAVVVCGPTMVLWENVLNYDYLTAALLVLMVDAAARWVRNGRTAAFAALSALGGATVLLRSFMHPIFFAGIVVLALLLRRPERWNWRFAAAVGIPLALVGGAMLKNEIIFGSPELSSFFGYNVRRVAIGDMPHRMYARLVAQHVIRAPGPPKRCKVSHPDVPALAREFKPGITPPNPNENWDCLRKYRSDLTRDAIAVARAEPGWLARQIAGSAEIWAAPATLYWEVKPNQRHVAWLDHAYRIAPLGDIPWTPPVPTRPEGLTGFTLMPDGREHLSLTIVLATLMVCATGVAAAIDWRRRRRSPARAAMIIGAFTVAFGTAVTILLEHGENNRLRLAVEPLTLILAVAAVAAYGRRAKARRETRAAPILAERE